MNPEQKVTESGRLEIITPVSNTPWHVLELTVAFAIVATVVLVRWVG